MQLGSKRIKIQEPSVYSFSIQDKVFLGVQDYIRLGVQDCISLNILSVYHKHINWQTQYVLVCGMV